MEQNTTSHTQTPPGHIANPAEHDKYSAADAMVECVTRYAHERPEMVALWALGIGFVLGWKLKP